MFQDQLPDLIPIGRNGQHRYQNQDHSMLIALRQRRRVRSEPEPVA